MRGDVVHYWLEALLDPGEDQRHTSTALAKQRRHGKPDIVATPPRRAAFNDAPGPRKTSRIRIDDGQPVRAAGWRALDVVAFDEQVIVGRKLRAKVLCAACSKKE
jgi:hypothetical protein